MVKYTDAGCSGTAELRGRFFPLNLRRFLELLPLGCVVHAFLSTAFFQHTPSVKHQVKHGFSSILKKYLVYVMHLHFIFSICMLVILVLTVYRLIIISIQLYPTGAMESVHQLTQLSGEFVCPIFFVCPGSNGHEISIECCLPGKTLMLTLLMTLHERRVRWKTCVFFLVVGVPKKQLLWDKLSLMNFMAGLHYYRQFTSGRLAGV